MTVQYGDFRLDIDNAQFQYHQTPVFDEDGNYLCTKVTVTVVGVLPQSDE